MASRQGALENLELNMNVMVTGHRGYIGTVLTPILEQSGHRVVGLDSDLFRNADFGQPPPVVESIQVDIRDARPEHFKNLDAVIHLAGISNDPLGDLDPGLTLEINHLASVHIARLARQAGVRRFLYASSCSLYGAAKGHQQLDENAAFNPVTPYGQSKVLAERDLATLADEMFSPVYLRCATVYGSSPRLRADLVVNNLTAYAVTTGKVLLKSDGSAWRPLVHVEDVARAYLALLEAPVESVHNQAFNVGRDGENYQIRQVADRVGQVVPNCEVCFAAEASADERNYNVSFRKLQTGVPEYQPQWTVQRGIEQLHRDYLCLKMDEERLLGDTFLRIRDVRRLQGLGQLGQDLRWQKAC